MGCSPARPSDEPILISTNLNHIKDNNVTKIDQRVLSQKFKPIKQINSEVQLETAEALDILAFDPRNGLKKEFEVIGIPSYSSDNVTLSGKWIYIEDLNSTRTEVGFTRESQHKIEKEFIKGSLRCNIELYNNFAEIIFKDMIVIGTKNTEKKEHFSYAIKRVSLRREAYGWNADDGVIRPIVREIEDILNFTTGVYTYNFDGSQTL
jgi:hypothetical protein